MSLFIHFNPKKVYIKIFKISYTVNKGMGYQFMYMQPRAID